MTDQYVTKKFPTKNRSRASIPSQHAAGALSVHDGVVFVGTVVDGEGSFFSFDRDGVLLGEYRSQAEAMRIIPKAAS